MSGRYDNHKGSSRSTRDDSRQYKDVRKESRDEDEKRSSRSRSRSPRRRSSPARSSKYTPPSQRLSKQHRRDKESRNNEDKRSHRKSSNEWEAEEEEVPAPPPPPRITPISIGFAKPKGPIKMSLGGTTPKPKSAKPTVASVFNDDDDEPEEMPAEARMRMRNIGRETPTSAGPNSFGKTKQGFCDAKKVFEKNLKNSLDTVERPAIPKFAQTIYKIKPTS